jgi:hypothetical protein
MLVLPLPDVEVEELPLIALESALEVLPTLEMLLMKGPRRKCLAPSNCRQNSRCESVAEGKLYLPLAWVF